MSNLGLTGSVATIAALVLVGCSTPPKASAPMLPSPVQPAAKPALTLADEIQGTIDAIDSAMSGYDGILTRIQQLPDDKNPGEIIGEVGDYVGSERLGVKEVPAEKDIVAGISGSVSTNSWLAIVETELLGSLVDLTRQLVRLNARTATLALDYEQGRTLQKYAVKIRRELMPLLAELRRLGVADRLDKAAVANLEFETLRIITASRQSLQSLEHDTRAIESELGGRQ